MNMIKKELFNLIAREVFYVLTCALAAFSISELIWPNIILAYININHVLILWVMVVILIIVSSNKNKE